MAENPPVNLLALEEALRADEGGRLKQSLRDEIDQYRGQVRRTLDAGVPPAQFQALSRWLVALDAAGEVVEAVWRRQHPAT